MQKVKCMWLDTIIKEQQIIAFRVEFKVMRSMHEYIKKKKKEMECTISD